MPVIINVLLNAQKMCFFLILKFVTLEMGTGAGKEVLTSEDAAARGFYEEKERQREKNYRCWKCMSYS